MATNNNGNLLDDAGNVVVDFVWGNFPLQPNDQRTNLLDYTLDGHIIADANYSGYPLFVPNSRGADTSLSVDYITVPNVLGKTTALAIDALKDVGFTTSAGVSTITTATAATNTAKSITRINVTTTKVATVYASGADTAYAVGSIVTIGAGTGIPAALVGNWTVTGSASGNITIAGTGWTVADTGVIAPAASLTGKSATIKAQSIAAATANVTAGTAITITPWA